MKPSILATLILSLCIHCSDANGENLLRNGGFEAADTNDHHLPAYWTDGHHQAQPLKFTSVHYEGKLAGLLEGDAHWHMWRKNVHAPQGRSWHLRAMVKSENAEFGKEEYAHLYCHVIYKDQPYSTADHFSVRFKPGTNDWTEVSIVGAATKQYPIDFLHITVGGKFSQGRFYVDDVQLSQDLSLTDESLLAEKVLDLRLHLVKAGVVDESVDECIDFLDKTDAALKSDPIDLGMATSHWHSAAKMLSHEVWAAMFPNAMAADKEVEARMLYHGMGATKEDTNSYLDKIELTGCNAVYLSFGSWMYVNYHSDILPVEPGWEEFDALTYFIEEAHQRGLTVFGYYAPFYGTNDIKRLPRSIAVDHPEWLADGPNMPKFPDAANPEVVKYILSVYEELVTRYDLDGIGLDYIRYPTPNSLNYDENNRQRILERYGIDILEHEDLYGDPEAWAKIQEYRRDTISAVVKQVHDTVKAARPDISIMACLVSELDMARTEYAQDWEKSTRWIDYASHMNYDDMSLDSEMLLRQRDICRRNNSVYIPAIGGMPKIHRSWPISEWARRVALQRKLGADGIIIYRIAEFDTAVAAFFGNGPFYGDARFPNPLKEN